MKELLDNLDGYKIILGSASPRRQDLLKSLGIDFKVRLKEVIENYPNGLKGSEIAEYLAELKSQAYKKDLSPGEILVTGDTIVCLDEKALGKPDNFGQAHKMLEALSGRSHRVISSVCLRTVGERRVFHDSANVIFSRLTEEEINYYIHNFKPFDKAGAYGIQEWIGMIGVEKIVGSYFTVMGFPVHRFYRELKNFLALLP